MRSLSSPSSSHNPREDISLANRLKTIFKKAYELSTLCEIEVCVIYYGPGGELKTWPEEREKVRDMALRYNAATKRKKSLNLHEFLNDEKDKKKQNKKQLKKKKRELENVNGIKYPTWYPSFDHYSPQQLSELILSLEKTLCTLQERLRVIEARKQMNTNLVQQSSMNQYQTQPLNPNQFSLYMYNHGDCTLSKLQLTDYQNQFIPQQIYGFDQHITNTNFQQPTVSNTQDHSTLLSVQETALNNYLLKNELMQQHELYGFDQNITNTNFQQPTVSSTQDCSMGQESALNDYLFKNNMMQQHELYGFDQDMSMIGHQMVS